MTRGLAGIYPPVPTFFDGDETLDLATLRRHVRQLAAAGITGFVALGSNGEAVHLDDDERRQVIAAVRETAGADAQVLAGAGALSTRAIIVLCRLAAEAGADIALVLPPHYYRSGMTMPALTAHYLAVAEASPIPVAIYNIPANTAGIDLDADTVLALAAHPNIIGLKDSAGMVAKLAQVAGTARRDFAVLAGSAGFLLPALAIGATGTIAALANVAPRPCLELMALWHDRKLDEARALQARLVAPNAAVTSGYGVAGLKAALEIVAGYGGAPRRPLLPLGATERERLYAILAHAGIEREGAH